MKLRALALAVAVAACGKRPSEDECRAMLDRYVDMTIDDDPDIAKAPERTRGALREIKKEQKRGTGPYKSSLERCTHEVSRRELDCAMKAPSPNAWEACID